jgi:hypothetical protein
MNKTLETTVEIKKDDNKVEFKISKKLTSFLQSAMNTATSLTNYIPKITEELIVVINQYQTNMKEKITLSDDQTRFDTFKSLREYSYGLVDYDRTDKNNQNKAFEMIVLRSIESALMSVNNHGSMQILDGVLVAESKAVKPTTKKENHDKRIKAKFVSEPNKETTLIPVNTTAIDDMWKRFNGTASSGGSKGNKSNIKTSASNFVKDLAHIIELAKNKKYEQFFSLLSEQCIDDIINIKTLLSSELVRNTYAYCEENLQVDGSIKKAVNQ